MLTKIIQVRIFRSDGQYVADCLDLPVVTQGKTLDEFSASPSAVGVGRWQVGMAKYSCLGRQSGRG